MNEGISSLVERIAAAASLPGDLVEQVLNDYTLNLRTGNRRHRSIRLDRLRIRGMKSGGVDSGAFDETFEFRAGVTVIAADNLKGKTSILEVLTLVLRGKAGNLQSDILAWLQEISLDTYINSQPIGFRLSLEDSEITRGRILSGTRQGIAASDDSLAANVTELEHTRGRDEWADLVGPFMLKQLGLEEIQVFNQPVRGKEVGNIKAHGWPSYFSVLYPPPGADTILLGGTVADQLPVKLMQVFLDMPEAARSMRVRALAQRLESEFNSEQRHSSRTKEILAKQLQEAQQRQVVAEARLAELRAQAPAESLQELAKLADDIGARLANARHAAEEASALFAQAKASRISDEKSLNTLRESKAASLLFHGLDPQFCPRCETSISDERRASEHESHQCAVCEKALQVQDEDDYAERERQADEALEASRAAETALNATRSTAQHELAAAQAEFDSIGGRIAQAQAVHQAVEQIEAEQALASARAVVEALRTMVPDEAKPSNGLVVLRAADVLLREDIKEVSAELYSTLSDATRNLAISFGIDELERIRIKGNGHMDVTKGGGSTSSFSSQSAGERLRLRYALVVALLRTARSRGIAGHPGLLLFDSLKAEEVQDDHAQVLLQGLVTAAAEEPGLQILVTTADETLAASVSGVTATILPKPGRTSLF